MPAAHWGWQEIVRNNHLLATNLHLPAVYKVGTAASRHLYHPHMSKIRLGFIGAGTMGQVAHLRNYATFKDCELAALAEIRPGLAAKVAARYGIPEVYASHEELLAKAKVDALVVIQQFTIHGRLLPAIIRSGLPFIIEKPLARSVETARALAQLVAERSAKVYIAYHKRSDPAATLMAEKIREWKASGCFGALRYIRVTMPPGQWTAEGFSTVLGTDEAYPPLTEDALPEGFTIAQGKEFTALVNFYIHQINLVSYLLGEDYRVTAADANGQYLGLRSGSGVSGIIEMAPYRTTRDWQESVLVGFEKGWLRLDLPAPLVMDRPGALTIFQDAGGSDEPVELRPIFPDWHAMRAQAGNFLRAVRGEPTPLCGPAQAVRDLEIAAEFIRLQVAQGGIKLSF
jgi:predicted dehydrogenase